MDLALFTGFVLLFLMLIPFKIKKDGSKSLLPPDEMLPIRGFAIVIIILLHLCYKADKVKDSEYLGFMMVGIFFLLSGYGLFCGICKKGKDYLNGFLKHRLTRLFIPFIIVLISVFLLRTFLLGRSVQPSIIREILLGNYVPNTWYILALALFNVFFYFSFKYLKKEHAIISGFVFSAVYFVVMYLLGNRGYWITTSFLFPIGVLLRHYEERIMDFCRRRYWAMLLGSFGLSVIFEIVFRLIGRIGSEPILLLFFNARLAPVILFIITVMQKVRLNNPVLCFLGKYSYEIYLVHGFIISIVDYVLSVQFKFFRNGFVFVAAVFAISLISAYLLYIANKKIFTVSWLKSK